MDEARAQFRVGAGALEEETDQLGGICAGGAFLEEGEELFLGGRPRHPREGRGVGGVMGASFVGGDVDGVAMGVVVAEVLKAVGVVVNAEIEFPAGYTTTHRDILDCRQPHPTRISLYTNERYFRYLFAIAKCDWARRAAALAQAVGTTYNR